MIEPFLLVTSPRVEQEIYGLTFLKYMVKYNNNIPQSEGFILSYFKKHDFFANFIGKTDFFINQTLDFYKNSCYYKQFFS